MRLMNLNYASMKQEYNKNKFKRGSIIILVINNRYFMNTKATKKGVYKCIT